MKITIGFGSRSSGYQYKKDYKCEKLLLKITIALSVNSLIGKKAHAKPRNRRFKCHLEENHIKCYGHEFEMMYGLDPKPFNNSEKKNLNYNNLEKTILFHIFSRRLVK